MTGRDDASNWAAPVNLTDLIAAEVHELKNRLGHLTLDLDELAAHDTHMAEVLRDARNTCHRVGASLVQVLTLYKSEQGGIPLNVEAHSPAEIVGELKADADSLVGAGVQIAVEVDGAPPFWFFDRYLVGVVMATAVHNAIKFARGRVVIGARPEAGGLCLFVQDDSPGYPPEMLAQQGRRPTGSATGTGLGLYFAHLLAGAHANEGRVGTVRLENRDGAIFSLWLP